MNARIGLLSVSVVSILLLPAQAAKIVPGDAQDVVFLGTGRPVFIRLHVQINGQGFETMWNAYVAKLFKQLDRDKDGKLSRDEAGRGPWQALGTGVYSQPGVPAMPRTLSRSLSVSGEPVTPEQFRAALREDTRPLVASDRRSTSSTQSRMLLAQLDRDRDGKMSAKELELAEESLRRLDRDDDEMLTADELQGNPSNGYVVRQLGGATNRGPASTKLLLLGRSQSAQSVVQAILKKYGKATKGKVTQQEIGLSEEEFAKHDADEDGNLDADELAAMVEGPRPDLEVIVRLGTRKPRLPQYELNQADLKKLSAKIVTPADGTLALLTEEFRLEFSNPTQDWGVANDRANRLRRFNQADRDNNKYLDANESRRYFGNNFAAMDADGDEKVFEKEYLAYLDAQAEAAESRTFVTLHDHGRQLFQTLDANGDQRIGLREMRDTAQRLLPRDRDDDGAVDLGEVQHHYRLTFARGQAQGVYGVVTFVSDTRTSRPPRAPGRGPRWFQKMDRNGDGDVSPREFLGGREAFDKLDADGDELIDADEAAKGAK